MEDTDNGDAVRAPFLGAQEKGGGHAEQSVWGEGLFREGKTYQIIMIL